MATTKLTIDRLATLMFERFDLVMSSISDLRVELKGDIQRLETRVENVEETLQQVRQTQLEDGNIYTSMLLDHQARIRRLEKQCTANKAPLGL